MSSQCDSCAFKPGAAANSEPYNRLRAEVCSMTGVPFWCHHGQDGSDFTSQSKFVTRRELQERGMRICEGWKREVRQHVRPGQNDTFHRLVERWKGEAILMFIEEFLNAEDGSPEKKELADRLHASIAKLHAVEGFV